VDIIALILMIGVGIVNFVCFVMVLIKIFGDEQNGGVGLGIFGIICGLYTFIWGWQNKDRHNLGTIMMVWTVGFIASLILNFTFQASMM